MEPDAYKLLGLDRDAFPTSEQVEEAIVRLREVGGVGLPQAEEAYLKIATAEARAHYHNVTPSVRIRPRPLYLPDTEWSTDHEAHKILLQPDYERKIEAEAYRMRRPLTHNTPSRQGPLDAHLIDVKDNIYRLQMEGWRERGFELGMEARSVPDAELREALSQTMQTMVENPAQVWSLKGLNALLRDVPRLGREHHFRTRPIDHTHVGLELFEEMCKHYIVDGICDRYDFKDLVDPRYPHRNVISRAPELAPERGEGWELSEPVIFSEKTRNKLSFALRNGMPSHISEYSTTLWKSEKQEYPPGRPDAVMPTEIWHNEIDDKGRRHPPYIDRDKTITPKTWLLLSEELLEYYGRFQIQGLLMAADFEDRARSGRLWGVVNHIIPLQDADVANFYRLIRESEREFGNRPHILFFPRPFLKHVQRMPLPQELRDWAAFRLMSPTDWVIRHDVLQLETPGEYDQQRWTRGYPLPERSLQGIPVYTESLHNGGSTFASIHRRIENGLFAGSGYFGMSPQQALIMGNSQAASPVFDTRADAHPEIALAAYAVAAAVSLLKDPAFPKEPEPYPPADRTTPMEDYVRTMAGTLLRPEEEPTPMRQAKLLLRTALQMTYYSRDPDAVYEAVLGGMLLAKAHRKKIAREPFTIPEGLDFTGFNTDPTPPLPVEHQYLLAHHDPMGVPYEVQIPKYNGFEITGYAKDKKRPVVCDWRSKPAIQPSLSLNLYHSRLINPDPAREDDRPR